MKSNDSNGLLDNEEKLKLDFEFMINNYLKHVISLTISQKDTLEHCEKNNND